MIPSAFVQMDALPLTSSGKVDFRALPVPNSNQEITDTFVPPQGTDEEALAHIWKEVLQIDRVGRHDSFFDLGGHSLLAIKIITGIEAVFQVKVLLRSLFEAPTVAGLSKIIKEQQAGQPFPQTPAIKPVSRSAYRQRR
jgi:syringomycin synthetase protein SyrE